MQRLLLTAGLCLLVPTLALADGRAFPPDGCSTLSPFMAFTAVNNSNTYCTDGQGILTNALPSCSEGQHVEFSGGKFVCANSEGPNACGPTQVLTFTTSGYMCVDKGANVPTCAANQFLTYNGSTFQCAATQKINIPTCTPNQYLNAPGGVLVCEDFPQSATPNPVPPHAEACGGTFVGDDAPPFPADGKNVPGCASNAHWLSTGNDSQPTWLLEYDVPAGMDCSCASFTPTPSSGSR